MPGKSDQNISKGYHGGTGVVRGDPDLVSANIKIGVNIFGVVGTYGRYHRSSRWQRPVKPSPIAIEMTAKCE